MIRSVSILILCAAITYVAWDNIALPYSREWTEQETALIKSLSLSELSPLSPDPSNRHGDNPIAAELGHSLFFDSRLSSNGAVSCASCHQPELSFTDGLPLAVGLDIGTRHTPSLLGLAHSPWFYWDGRKDSQWSQALAPLESSIEHNSNRLAISRLVSKDEKYRTLYESVFGGLPELPDAPANASPLGNVDTIANWNRLDTELQKEINQVYANVGKALASYQRKIIPAPGRFDHYADSLGVNESSTALNADEVAGLRLFINKGQCVSCHNGPLFTNHDFHNTGVLVVEGQLPPMGRYDGIRIARQDPFNCLGEFSDAKATDCIELRFAQDSNELVGAHKTPTLRNIAQTSPYMHGGQIQTLRDVLDHYNTAPTSMLSHNEAKPLGLRSVEIRQIEAFLHTLSAPLAIDRHWLRAP